jgi:hypothetical protein
MDESSGWTWRCFFGSKWGIHHSKKLGVAAQKDVTCQELDLPKTSILVTRKCADVLICAQQIEI